MEVIIVLALVALLASLGMATVDFFNNNLVATEMNKLYAAVMYMQRCAQVSNQPATISFNLADNSYSFDGHQERLPHNVHFGAPESIKGPPACAHWPITTPITFQNQEITCYPSGIIQSGTVYCSDAANAYVYALSCAVAQASYIRLYKYEGSWHLITHDTREAVCSSQ
jgi:hypothetical protein